MAKMNLKKKSFYCPRCRHYDDETTPSRLRCPKCGAAVPQPERGDILSVERRRLIDVSL